MKSLALMETLRALSQQLKQSLVQKDVAGKLKRIKEDDDLKNKVVKQQDELKILQNQFLELQKKINKTAPEKEYTLQEQRTDILKK